MNEFEALKRLRQETCPATYMPDFNKEECLEVIEKALLELKAIKEAKPSEALECLEKLGTIPMIVNEKTYDFKPIKKAIPNTYNTIKQYILKTDNLEKAWEIVKEKNVTMFELKCCSSAKSYNECISFKIGFVKNYELTQQEFDLLKEMLE